MKKEIIEWIKTIALSIVIAFLITTFIRPIKVDGISMYPTLNNNDYLISEKIHEIKRGDIISFKSQIPFTKEELKEFNVLQRIKLGKTKSLIKRVIAVEGDQVRVSDGKVFVNDQQLKEGYIDDSYTPGDVDIKEIPKGKVFVMGDNRDNSLDSRTIGIVDVDRIQGKVFARILPFSQFGKVE